MDTAGAALDLVAKLEAEGVAATADPRSATPPVVLVGVRDGRRDSNCSQAATFEVVALAPGPFNLDAVRALDVLATAVFAATNAESWTRGAYRLALDNPPLPCYLFTFTGGIDL